MKSPKLLSIEGGGGASHAPSGKPANEGYIEVGYEDKVVFAPKTKAKRQLKGVSDELHCQQTLRR